MVKKIIACIKLALSAAKATPAPPVGPVLGQYGINISEFCKEYNAKTQDKKGLVIPADITIFEDKSYSFTLKTPPVSTLLLQASNTLKGSKTPNNVIIGSITENQLNEIVHLKLRDLNTNNFNKARRIIKGTARNIGITITTDKRNCN
jgi:large subunit ribosomal protein L11